MLTGQYAIEWKLDVHNCLSIENANLLSRIASQLYQPLAASVGLACSQFNFVC